MKFALFLALAWLELSHLAIGAATNPFDYRKAIPEKVLRVPGASEGDVRKSWGEPQHAEDNKFFYEEAGYRYRLIVSFRQKKCRELEYALLDSKFTLGDFIAGGFAKSEIREFPKEGHDRGRFLTLTKKNGQGKWTFYFNTDSEKHLHHIFWEQVP
jgi:hypothetical protein